MIGSHCSDTDCEHYNINGCTGLYVLTSTDMPACLVETAFILNANDEQLWDDPTRQDRFAKAILRVISNCFK